MVRVDIICFKCIKGVPTLRGGKEDLLHSGGAVGEPNLSYFIPEISLWGASRKVTSVTQVAAPPVA